MSQGRRLLIEPPPAPAACSSADWPWRHFDQPIDLGAGQVLAGPVFGVPLPSRYGDCSFYSGWCHQFQRRFHHGFQCSGQGDCPNMTPIASRQNRAGAALLENRAQRARRQRAGAQPPRCADPARRQVDGALGAEPEGADVLMSRRGKTKNRSRAASGHANSRPASACAHSRRPQISFEISNPAANEFPS